MIGFVSSVSYIVSHRKIKERKRTPDKLKSIIQILPWFQKIQVKSLKHQSGFWFKSARKVEDSRKIGSIIRNLALKLF